MSGGWLDIALKVLGAVSAIAVVVLGAVFNRRLNKAKAALDTAGAQAAVATAEKTREETRGIAVTNAERLIALYQAQQEKEARLAAERQAEKDAESAQHRAESEARIRALEKEVAHLRETTQAFTLSLLPHTIWDGNVLQIVRDTHDKDYPAPPSFGLDGERPGTT